MAEAIRRLLFIVGSQRRDFYASLRRTFRGDDTVQVVLDRRRGERRLGRRAAGRKGGASTVRRSDARTWRSSGSCASAATPSSVSWARTRRPPARPRAKRARDTAR